MSKLGSLTIIVFTVYNILSIALNLKYTLPLLFVLQMNSTGSIFDSPDLSGSQFTPSDGFVRANGGSSAQPGTSCSEDKQTSSPGQCFLTHSNHVNATAAHRECDASTSTASPGDLAFAQKVGTVNPKHAHSVFAFAISSFFL